MTPMGGATTLLLIAGALLAPDRGRVELDGIDPYELSSDKRASFRAGKIGFVFQQFQLIPYLSVIENIMLSRLVVPDQSAEGRAEELLKKFELEHRRRHLPSELSIGERQRTAMARALLHSPSLLLADEPTGNLDHENRQHVLDALRSFAESGHHVIMVTHSDEAAGQADRVVEL